MPIDVSNADRVIFPDAGITKGDVVAHYVAVGERILPHVEARPLTLVRYPKGIGEKGFFQKNVAKHYPEPLIGRIEIPRRSGVTVHPAASSVDALAYLANQGTIEFHVPLCTRADPWKHDRLVFDLDPPEGADDAAREAAWACKALMDELGVACAPVATGSKGFHVYARLDPSASTGRTAHLLAAILVHRHPALLTHEVLKENRGGRVLVDWMRNAGQATVVAPWSLRARPGAPVAVPVAWEALSDTAPDAFRLGQDLDRPDPLLTLPPVDPTRLAEAAEGMFDAAGIELEHIDRFGRRMR